MPKAPNTTAKPSSSAAEEPQAHQGTAQQIWLAGLGALAQAQAQGTKAFEALVSDGLKMQQKTQAEAQQRLQEATERLTHLAQDFGQQASGRVDRLEQMFEDRVARALQRLGIPAVADLQQLQARVEALEAAVQRTARSRTAADRAEPTTARARKTVAKADARSAGQTTGKPHR